MGQVPQKLSHPAPCWAGEGLGVSACTKAPKAVPTVGSKGTSPQGLHPSPVLMGRDGAAATLMLGAGGPVGQERSPKLRQPQAAAPLCSLPSRSQAGAAPGCPTPDGCRTGARIPRLPGKHPPPPLFRKCLLAAGAGVEMGQVGTWALWGHLLPYGAGQAQGVWTGCQGGRSHPSVFSRKQNRAEVGNTPPAGPLPWWCCPGVIGLGLPRGAGAARPPPQSPRGCSVVSAWVPAEQRDRSGPRRALGAGPPTSHFPLPFPHSGAPSLMSLPLSSPEWPS